MIRRPPRSTLSPTRRSSDLGHVGLGRHVAGDGHRAGAETPYGVERVVGLPQVGEDQPVTVGGEHLGDPATDTLGGAGHDGADRKSTRLNSSHSQISYAVFCL